MTVIVNAHRPVYAHSPRSHWPPSLIIIHATRGHTSNALQDDATIGFFANPGNRGGWGPTADCLVSADEDKCYVFESGVAQLRQWRSSWSAGYGSSGPSSEWGADEVAISIEVAESDQLEGYTDATVRRVAWLCAELQRQLGFTIPPERVRTWDQRRSAPLPQGYIGHEDLLNGRKSGKTDPGARWPWDQFLRLLKPERAPAEPPMQTTKRVPDGFYPEALTRLEIFARTRGLAGGGGVTIADAGDHFLVSIRK